MQAFDPGDDRFLPFFDAAAELGLIVLTHAGTSGLGAGEPGGQGLRIDLARPILLDRIAARHPQMQIVLAHVGWPWHLEAVAMALHKSNVYLDISGWKYRYLPDDGQARDPAAAARAVRVRDRLSDVRPRGLPDRARPARAARGVATAGAARQRRGATGPVIELVELEGDHSAAERAKLHDGEENAFQSSHLGMYWEDHERRLVLLDNGRMIACAGLLVADVTVADSTFGVVASAA
jgi:hypothetical protein